MTERDHQRSLVRPGTSTADPDIAPGRSRSQDLVAPTHPITSGLIRRKARDDNGVADGAAQHVSAASAGSGSPLPALLQRKFESSLGADLSSVRVHTDATSATAADSVGARAYTLGQDIHFGAGHFDPSSGAGEHLLAHEVAHTVQQHGTTPTRQNKLEVSSPGDALEVEADRAADAMVAGHSAGITSSSISYSRAIHRDKDPKQTPYPGPPPPTPFDDSQVPPQVRAAVDQLSMDGLRALTSGAIGSANALFVGACDDVHMKLDKKEAARAEAQKEWRDLVLGAVGFALGPLAAAAGAKLAAAGPALQQSLIAKIEQDLPTQLAKEGTDPMTSKWLTSEAIERVASDRVTKLVSLLSPDQGKGLVGVVASKVATVMAKVDLLGTPAEKAMSYVQALKIAALEDGKSLKDGAGVCTDAPTLLALHSRFMGATYAAYFGDLEARAHDFGKQIGNAAGANAQEEIVVIQAYGQDRLATVRYLSDSANYTFKSWITPDMEPIARQLTPNPRRLEPKLIVDHLPEPIVEGAEDGNEHIAHCNGWGGRYVVVRGVEGQYVFAAWVGRDQEPGAVARGALQLGGIPELEPAQIKNTPAPTD